MPNLIAQPWLAGWLFNGIDPFAVGCECDLKCRVYGIGMRGRAWLIQIYWTGGMMEVTAHSLFGQCGLRGSMCGRQVRSFGGPFHPDAGSRKTVRVDAAFGRPRSRMNGSGVRCPTGPVCVRHFGKFPGTVPSMFLICICRRTIWTWNSMTDFTSWKLFKNACQSYGTMAL